MVIGCLPVVAAAVGSDCIPFGSAQIPDNSTSSPSPWVSGSSDSRSFQSPFGHETQRQVVAVAATAAAALAVVAAEPFAADSCEVA